MIVTTSWETKGTPSVAFNNNGSQLFSVLAVGAPNGTVPIQIGVDDTAPLPPAPPVALECLLQDCIRTMEANFINGNFLETVLSEWTNQSQFPQFDEAYLTLRSPKTGAEFVVEYTAVTGNQKWLSPMLVGDVYVFPVDYVTTPVFSTSISQFIYMAMNSSRTGFQDLMDNLANSLSVSLRTIKYQPPLIDEQAFTPNSQAVVVWEWLILPVFELIATLLLLIVIILETEKKGMVPWGNSALAYVFHGLNKRPDDWSQSESQHDMESAPASCW
ncbi:hypothetical protein F5Y03DRAFT_3132 [Xylaria venustula]|nr:hypothetical protein F5Y03DRAFT_3132 [Xylaria venustula]